MADIFVKLPFFCSALMAGLGLNAAYSGEKPSQSDALFDVQQQAHFDERWAAKNTEFQVGTDGAVLPLAQAGDDAVQSGAAPSGALLNFTGIAHIPAAALPEKAETKAQTSSVQTAEPCRASSLTPDEIRALVEETAQRYNVDAGFAVAIVHAESRFDRFRNSGKGARGPMQLMPETAARFGVKNICDPQENITGGIRYLRALLDEFQNPLLAAAAYNAGEGRIYEYGGVPPLPETVNYVAQVVNYQLGLPDPSIKSGRKAKPAKLVQAAASAAETGIIPVQKTRRFVGGVMNF